jgi:hypothetical protein
MTRIAAAFEFRKLSFGHLISLATNQALDKITIDQLTEILTNRNYLNMLITPSDITFLAKSLDAQKQAEIDC